MTNLLADGTTQELVIRMLLAMVLGGLIGYEREIHHKPAGFRTHILVSLGSALFTIVSIFGFGDIAYGDGSGVALRDASRVAAQIVVGVGFLAAGIIIQNRDSDGSASVRGLTTAASVWVVAAVGMAAGSGMKVVAIISSILLLIILAVLDRFEDAWIKRWQEVKIITKVKNEPKVLAEVLKGLNKHRSIVQTIDVRQEADGMAAITLGVILHPRIPRESALNSILRVEGVHEAKID